MARTGDERFIRCCLLYWAEGAKSRHSLSFSNSDPEMIRFWVDLLRETFAIADERIRIGCYLYPDHVEEQRSIEDFWLDVTRLERANLCKSIVNNYSRSSQRKRRRTLPYGTCKVAVHDTRLVHTVLGGIQEIAGFRRDEWLDMS